MDISYINMINESELISTICKAKDVAMREINDIYDNFGNGHNGNCGCEHQRHDRMIHNLRKSVEVIRDVIYIKAAILGYLNGNNNISKISVTRETKPTNGVSMNTSGTMVNSATIS